MPSTCDPTAPIKKEVIRFKAKKYDGCARPEAKTFSVDPDLTTFSTLRELLIKAFDIKTDFVISYLVRGHKGAEDRYLPMLSEWDLNTAIYGASDPHVVLKVDLKPFETSGLDEWDIIDEDDVARVSAQHSSVFTGSIPSVRQLFGESSSSTNGVAHSKRNRGRSWFFGRVTDTSNASKQPNIAHDSSTISIGKKSSNSKSPMTDAEFRSYLDAEGRLLHPNLFRIAVFKGGLESSLRPVVWRHLLNIYPEGLTGEERIAYTKRLAEKYCCLRESWQRRMRQGFIGEELRLVANAVRKDVIRTDRTHPFFSGDEDTNKNLMALFNLLTTYALAHPEVSYCQGMSDLAAPLLVVMKDEAQAYISFCALMRRMKQNFACDGWAMTRKFQHLSELLQYYDPTFYEYLREMHADDLLFAYRWLLLELKREFSFDDALTLMEVVWASLPPTPPPKGCDLDLYDVDLTANDDSLAPFGSMSSWSSPAGSASTLLSPMQLKKPLADDDDGILDDSGEFTIRGDTSGGGDISAVSRSSARPCRQSSRTSTHSCPGHFGCPDLICPALMVRSLMLNHRENTRLHALRHASYPPKFSAIRLAVDDHDDEKAAFSRFSTCCCVEQLSSDVHGTLTTVEPATSEEREIQRTAAVRSHDSEKTNGEEIDKAPGTNSFDWNLQSARRRGTDASARSYAVCPSSEMKVKDRSDNNGDPAPSSSGTSPQRVLPALVAADAGSESELNWQKEDLEGRELTLMDIHDICLSHIPLEGASPLKLHSAGSTKNSSSTVDRSREPSGGPGLMVTSAAPVATLGSQVTKSRHASSSATSYIVTNLDSGYSDGNNTALTRSMDLASRASTTASTDPQNVADVAEFINIDRDPRVLLPAPHEFGDGNPFMLFVCLTLLLQHRDHIMKNQMDFNEIAIYFDKLMRKHNVHKVLKRARVLFADYVRTGWFDNSTTITRSTRHNGDDRGPANGHNAGYWSLF